MLQVLIPWRKLLAGMLLGVAAGATAAALPAAAGTVRVQAGQTLTALARQYGTTVAALAAANHLADPNLLPIGTVLTIPGDGGAGAVTVRVEAGQTLTALARQYHTTVAALAAANHLADPNLLPIGTVLTVPGAGAGSGASGGTVTVGLGETLTSVAAAHGTTVAALAAANGIANANVVLAGTVLRLPSGSTVQLADYTVPVPAASGDAGLPAQLLAHPSRLVLRPLFVEWADHFGVPPALLEALCWWESGWQTQILSPTGAIGVGQLEPSTVAFVNQVLLGGTTLSPWVASDNIEMSAAFLHHLLAGAGGSASLALADYYQGAQSVAQHGLLADTRQYVDGILAYVPAFS